MLFRSKLCRQVRSDIINECGIRDIWPVLAESSTWGYGASGTFGFGAPGVSDRFHQCGHSDYFTEEMVTKYWLPWFERAEMIRTGHDTSSPHYWSFLTVAKIKYVALFLILVLLGWLALENWSQIFAKLLWIVGT